MLIYCSHKYEGKKENIDRATQIIKELQKNDIENTYVSPLHAFSFLDYNEIGYEEEMQLCEDLLMMCDKLLVLSDKSKGVEREIELAKLCKIDIEYL